MKKRNSDTVLRSVQPNAGIRAAYQAKLDRLIDRMNRSVMRYVVAVYRANEPVIAMDAIPAREIDRVIAALAKRWERRFDEASEAMADYFAEAVEDRTSGAMKKILRDGGISVKFKPTRAMKDIVAATTAENVGLIKSIPSRYFSEIQGLVMRSVASGRDLGKLTTDLQKRYRITKKRAALIARDQNNKATSAMTRARQTELGITEAIWKHSHAGKEPRPTHLKNDGKRYNVNEGWYDPAVKEFIHPGQLINCRCTSKSVIPGFA